MKKLIGTKVRFQLAAAPGSTVYLAGTFNNWDPKARPMKQKPGGGHYEATLRLQPGIYEYKFIVNGEWRIDPECAEWTPNDHGSLNSVTTVQEDGQ